jgi:hypothetical protein
VFFLGKKNLQGDIILCFLVAHIKIYKEIFIGAFFLCNLKLVFVGIDYRRK